jgi:hypothetical protein
MYNTAARALLKLFYHFEEKQMRFSKQVQKGFAEGPV